MHLHVLACCSESAQLHSCKGALSFLLCIAVATASLNTFHLASVAPSSKTQVTNLPKCQTQGVDGGGHGRASMGSQHATFIFSAHLEGRPCTSARAGGPGPSGRGLWSCQAESFLPYRDEEGNSLGQLSCQVTVMGREAMPLQYVSSALVEVCVLHLR